MTACSVLFQEEEEEVCVGRGGVGVVGVRKCEGRQNLVIAGRPVSKKHIFKLKFLLEWTCERLAPTTERCAKVNIC